MGAIKNILIEATETAFDNLTGDLKDFDDLDPTAQLHLYESFQKWLYNQEVLLELYCAQAADKLASDTKTL